MVKLSILNEQYEQYNRLKSLKMDSKLLWSFKKRLPHVPDFLCYEISIQKGEELAGRVLSADSLTLSIVVCEQEPVVFSVKVHVLVHLRQTRFWEAKHKVKWDEGVSLNVSSTDSYELTRVRLAGERLQRKTRGDTNQWSLRSWFSRGGGF